MKFSICGKSKPVQNCHRTCQLQLVHLAHSGVSDISPDSKINLQDQHLRSRLHQNTSNRSREKLKMRDFPVVKVSERTVIT